MNNQLEVWNRTNPCNKCRGACCEAGASRERSTFIPVTQGIFGAYAFGHLAPYVINPESAHPIVLGDSSTMPEKPGVWQVVTKKGVFGLLLNMVNCPLLGEDGKCTKHDNGRPRGCIISDFEGPMCRLRRRD